MPYLLPFSRKKASSIPRIFIIILFAILADEAMYGVLLETAAPIDPTGWVSNSFLALSIPFALFLASLSDFHCRRRVMIFSLSCLSLSGLFISYFHVSGHHFIVYIALACKTMGGNVTPIALASLATIMPARKFTLALAIAICAYSFGSWSPIYFRTLIFPFTATLLSILCLIVTIGWFKETKFDDFRLRNNDLVLHRFFSFVRKDCKIIAIFCLLTPVVLVFLAFITSEISFYQILLRGEVLEKNEFYSLLAMKMGLGYYLGTVILFILKWKKVSDLFCLKAGIIISLLFFFASLVFKDLNNLYIVVLSVGFSLFTPAIFSILSKMRKLNEQGKIYGLLDSADIISIIITTGYIKGSEYATYDQVLSISSTILLISGIFICSFIKHVTNMRQKNDFNRGKQSN